MSWLGVLAYIIRQIPGTSFSEDDFRPTVFVSSPHELAWGISLHYSKITDTSFTEDDFWPTEMFNFFPPFHHPGLTTNQLSVFLTFARLATVKSPII